MWGWNSNSFIRFVDTLVCNFLNKIFKCNYLHIHLAQKNRRSTEPAQEFVGFVERKLNTHFQAQCCQSSPSLRIVSKRGMWNAIVHRRLRARCKLSLITLDKWPGAKCCDHRKRHTKQPGSWHPSRRWNARALLSVTVCFVERRQHFAAIGQS